MEIWHSGMESHLADYRRDCRKRWNWIL